jgi:hypothetical protein
MIYEIFFQEVVLLSQTAKVATENNPGFAWRPWRTWRFIFN